MLNVFKRIFTAANFEAGFLMSILLLAFALVIAVMGWKILFIPITIVAIAVLGTIVRYAINKFNL